ncbi:hypothetical protein [Methanomicrobium mobile]|jgi:HSP20 family molecular chaperone IbpA|uniref:hypothetical protein n=1 Tax=Methanomicrobium mobile TaxID=2205 RepID=UPI0005B2BDF4|nr:hypothetical protein [Methanomicrobium mobile]
MSQDDDLDNEINDAIKKLFKEMMKDGRFPFQGKFSVMISGGRIPIDVNQPKKECPEDCDDCEDGCPHAGNSGRYVTNPHGKKVRSYQGLSRMNTDFVEKKPYTEYYETDGKIHVSADMPGSDLSNTAISVTDDVNGNYLNITAFTGDVRYSAVVHTSKVKKETMKYMSRNGILEIAADLADTDDGIDIAEISEAVPEEKNEE